MRKCPKASMNAQCLPVTRLTDMSWLYMIVFSSIVALTYIAELGGVAVLGALSAATSVAVVAVSLVKSLLGQGIGIGNLAAGAFTLMRSSQLGAMGYGVSAADPTRPADPMWHWG
ncbi:hypothetical protein [Amycolatopsis sp. NPDC051061]|uniref:hypothetical protein n=1 Tax=Amycolatopsis sp. NPDC051061 TaxID=3155042 RepID=UPI0034335789